DVGSAERGADDRGGAGPAAKEQGCDAERGGDRGEQRGGDRDQHGEGLVRHAELVGEERDERVEQLSGDGREEQERGRDERGDAKGIATWAHGGSLGHGSTLVTAILARP